MHKAVDISENEATDAPIPASMCESLPVEAGGGDTPLLEKSAPAVNPRAQAG